MNLSNVNFNAFRADVEKALAAVAEKYGCDVTAGKIKYDDISINLSLDFKARGENGESGEQMEFNKLCGNYGFKPEHYKVPFIMDGKTFYLIGFNPKARKYYCIISDINDKKFGCTVEAVKICMGMLSDLGYKEA